MKATIHPKWYTECEVSCVCGNVFVMGATIPQLKVEICSSCHPFYTGQMKYIDTAGRVDAFRAKREGADKNSLSKDQRRANKKAMKIQKELDKPETLAELRKK